MFPTAPAKINAKPIEYNTVALLKVFISQKPIKKAATIRNKLKINFAEFSEMNGKKSSSLAPQAIPLFSINNNLNQPQSIIGSIPKKVMG